MSVVESGKSQSPSTSHSQVSTFDRAQFDAVTRPYMALVNARLPMLLPAVPPELKLLHSACEYSLMAGGKRLRPLLVLLACEAAGGFIDSALPVACAYEFVHTYSLIHDDLPAMDDDDLRRGQPTCHKKFGEGQAILAGDALLTHAFEIVAKHAPSDAIARRLVLELAQAAGIPGMVGGQSADLLFENQAPTEATLQFIHVRKTGALLKSSVRAGAILAGVCDDMMRAFDEYGTAVGLAFQVVDDILDLTSTPEQLGKSVGKDREQKKITYPAVYGVEESRRIAGRLADRAITALLHLGERAAKLADLARYVVMRLN